MAETHPLDPLTTTELASAVAAARADGRLSPRTRFWDAALDEAHARTVAGAGHPPTGQRRLRLVVLDPGEAAWEVDVELASGGARCLAWRPVDTRRPGITSAEARAAAQACRDDPRFREALARRGIHDVSLVMVDPESIGGFVPARYQGHRLAWGTVWHRTTEDDNGYARPVQDVVPIIDLQAMRVLEVEDHAATDQDLIPVSPEAGPLEPGRWGPERPGLTALDVVQPDGPSFTVAGYRVSWQGWTLQVGFTHREGLVLHDLTFLGRPVLRRAACNEMYVPYLDPNPTQYRKNFFDWGEYGAGPLTNSLALGCDCLGLIHYFDAAYLDGYGEPQVIPRAICLHEEDAGVLWKHHDARRGTGQVRRSRRLVISAFHTVANYDYGFYWSLFQDGRIELEVKLTGILSASGIHEGTEVRYGRVVAPHVQAPAHQHYFAMRLDMAVDGPRNRLVEEHAEPEPDPALDPYGNAVRNVRTPLLRESQAARRTDPATARRWRVESTTATNRYGEPTAYRLVLPDTAFPYGRPDSVTTRRAPFVHQHLWATPFDPAQRFIGGEYPNQAEPGADGVHVWQRQDRSLDGAELVLWPVLGTHHFPRPEQWPVMPVDSLRLRLEPDGFFDRNPALDLPDPSTLQHHSTQHHSTQHHSTQHHSTPHHNTQHHRTEPHCCD